ncbi:unnamed protein product [Nezara viridula]|uniref:Uncharacterized protein n=1 Tax=Nezara viridula TaxID=85310 RepID=A0A9P0MLA9_NEZVI|nr:unnamed protein product [Nezara viridula]
MSIFKEKLCLHIAMKNEAVFSACGFFNVNNSFMHSMVAAVTSYLVILIQLDRQILASKRIISSTATTASMYNITIEYLPSS